MTRGGGNLLDVTFHWNLRSITRFLHLSVFSHLAYNVVLIWLNCLAICTTANDRILFHFLGSEPSLGYAKPFLVMRCSVVIIFRFYAPFFSFPFPSCCIFLFNLWYTKCSWLGLIFSRSIGKQY
ncbi:hypothetical protein CPB84DRAFT_1040113 [Gymnopilus junonius]|uniref:Uncharacterized protein n=1 Tax=Gymnopilus junonius TaxID=109634 RepID=A0A9P5NQ82_GYMJU|nr:hypothetical protein CPB84DRAFT_1040113 [Gymnopilus junonius]